MMSTRQPEAGAPQASVPLFEWDSRTVEGPLWADAVFALGMSLVMGWLARSRFREPPAGDLVLLRPPRAVLVLGVVGWLFTLFVAGGLRLYPSPEGPSAIVMLAFGSFLSLPLIAEYLKVQHHLEPGGFRYRPLISRPGTLRWTDVSLVTYSAVWKWFRIETVNGEVVRVSAMLIGLPAFAQAVLKEVPPDNIDPRARSLLEETAAGRPPSIWV